MVAFSFCRKEVVKQTVFLAFALLASLGLQTSVLGEKYTPDHPAVQEMVKNGVAFLTSKGPGLGGEGVNLLVGYTIFKVDGNPDHPTVASAVREARQIAGSLSSGRSTAESRSMYVPAVAAMLLTSVDVEAHGTQIRQIRDFMLYSQKTHGGFGYLVEGQYLTSGDISQTQYALLSLWTMSQLGIEVPDEPIAKCINFLAAAQTNDGGWPYQSMGQAAEAGTSTNSLAAAGFSALLIGGDLLGLYRSKIAENQEEEGIIPNVFKRIMPDAQKVRASFDRARLDAAAKKGEAWHLSPANIYKRAQWHYYYLYSRERYESFLEITKGKVQKSPDWYNQVVESLRESQTPTGGWGVTAKDGDGLLGAEVCTSFAILFLIRSTQKAIGALNEAYYVGGDSLPDDLTSVRAEGGKVISKSSTTSIDDALKLLEDEKKPGIESKLVADKMQLASDPSQRKEQLNRFVRLLNAKDPETRKIAAKMLGRGDDLDVVPALIYAVSTDPDPELPRIAEQSLRLISRQLDTHYLPKDKGTKLSDQTKSKAGLQWKKWYLGLRPDHVFID